MQIEPEPIGSPSMSPGTGATFEDWLVERPRWLQAAAKQLLDAQRRLNSTELDTLAELAVAEATSADAAFAAVPAGSFDTPTPMVPIRIMSMANVCGANALPQNAQLHFGDAALSVIYGPNGAGKSSFSRILKQICGSTAKTDIIPDVYSESPEPPSAIVRIRKGGQESDHSWTLLGGPLPQLRHVHVFDGRAAQVYLTTRTAAAYEPRRMRFVSMLIQTCDAVTEVLNSRRGQLVSSLPEFPTLLSTTGGAEFIRKLRATQKDEGIVVACSYTETEHRERVTLEASLLEKDVSKQIVALAADKRRLESVSAALDTLIDKLSDGQIERLRRLKLDAAAKQLAATTEAAKILKTAELPGVGEKAWLALWAAARDYSQHHAYPDLMYPTVADGSRCVLCHQTLSGSAAQRLTDFDRHVQGTLERAAQQAARDWQAAELTLPTIPSAEIWLTYADFLRIPHEIAKQQLGAAQTRLQQVVAPSPGLLEPIDWEPFVTGLQTTKSELLQRTEVLTRLQNAEQRVLLEKRLRELQAKEWMSQNISNIRAEVLRRRKDDVLVKAISLARTNLLTAKKNDLADEELARGYQQRFSAELANLDRAKRIRVQPVANKEGKGKITFSLDLKNAKRKVDATTVLSDGEQRVVALAAFLADITGIGQPTPFVFDDPISSLDQEFEERVVARLIDLAAERQVIVFTHRLSLTTLLSEAAESRAKLAKSMNLPAPVTIDVQSVRRLGATIGFVGAVPLHDAKPKEACIRMLDTKTGVVADLARLWAIGDIDRYNREMKAACSDFRILVERTVEKILLGDIVGRFRRSVQTMGRIGTLARVNDSDCSYIDSLMTKYSCFEHSQSDEISAWLPDAAEFKADVEELQRWIRDFEKRTPPDLPT